MPLPANGDLAGEIAMLRSRTPLSIGYSGDWGMAEALLAGSDAFYSVLGGLLPKQVMALAGAAKAGNADQVRGADAELKPLWETFKSFGSLRVMYVLLDLLRLGSFEPPRPILPLDTHARDQVLVAADRLWREWES